MEHLDLSHDELRHRPLERFAIDVGPSRQRQQGHVGAQLTQDRCPTARARAPENRPVRRIDEVDELAAVVIRDGADGIDHVVVQLRRPRARVAHVREQRVHDRPPLLEGEAEVAHAAPTRVRIIGGEQAGVHAGVDAHLHPVPAVDDLSPRDGPLLCNRHLGFVHEPHRFVRPHDVGPGIPGHDVRSENVVEVAVADEDVIRLVDVDHREPDLRGGGNTVEERIEPYRHPVDAQTERRGAEPFESQGRWRWRWHAPYWRICGRASIGRRVQLGWPRRAGRGRDRDRDRANAPDTLKSRALEL